MPLDPQIQLLVDNVPGGLSLPNGDPLVARDTFRRLNVMMRDNQPAADLAAIEDIEVPGARGALPARIYRPHAEAQTATLIFVHGGGFVVGDIEGYDLQARTLAERIGATVLSIHYGLAPENPFPDGADDVLSVTHWALDNVDKLGGDSARVGIAGDSAGGNLATVAALALGDRASALKCQLLIYPVVDFSGTYDSRTENALGPVLTTEGSVWFDSLYLSAPEQRKDPRVSPIFADDVSRLPPSIVVTAQFDPLRDEGSAYAAKLAAAGVPVKQLKYETLMHGFFGFGPLSAGADKAIDEICAAARELLDA
jgi:acetyl esterase